MARAATGTAPDSGQGWVVLGHALKLQGRWNEAEQAFRAAVRLDGMDPFARTGLGELYLSQSLPEEAMREYAMALSRAPASIPAMVGMGHALAALGRNEEALEQYEKAVALGRRGAEAEFAAGYVLARLERLDEAEVRYRRVLAQRPDCAAAWTNLGCLLQQQGRLNQAEAAFQRSIELRPESVSSWIHLSCLRRDQHRTAEAKQCLERAFALDAESVPVQLAWCQFCEAEGDLAGAWKWLRGVVCRAPDNAEAHNLRGILLHRADCFAEAIEAFERAEELGSEAAAANRGNCLLDLGRAKEARRTLEEAVAHSPMSAGSCYNLALLQLRLGEWKQGWANYEARWRFREVHRTPMRFKQPRWNGEPLNGRRILLHAEQGLGDAIQFCRYAALVAGRGGKVILQVHAPLMRLMQSMDVVRGGDAEVAELGIEASAFDAECPLMSLPAIFETEIESVPWSGAYLAADAELVAKKLAEFPRDGGKLRVGLAWAGNPRYKADRRRSTQLKTFWPLLKTAGVTWISLQKGAAAAQLKDVPDELAILDGAGGDRDLADTAALIDTLDLVITTDTSIAHLAGAMGKPVWIVLAHLPDWRWMEMRETSPWYPTARLFRQESPGDWGGVVKWIKAEISHSFKIA